MNKVTDGQITEPLIESLIHCSVNLTETPNFFSKVIKRVIVQGIPPAKKTQEVDVETATPAVEEAKDINVVSPTQYLVALGAHKVFLGNISAAQQQKVIQYLKNPYFSVKRIERELKVGIERPSDFRDNSDLESMLVRGLRVAHKIQQRNVTEFKDLPDQYITNESLKRVADVFVAKAMKADAAGKDFPVITFLNAVSDFPDVVFDFNNQEAAINKAIKEAYKNINVRLAFTNFIQIIGDERAQNSRKLSQKLMKEFSQVY